MKITYKNPEWIDNRINELQCQLLDIRNEYLANIEKEPVVPYRKTNFEDDYRVNVIRRQIAYYYTFSTPTIIVIPENEDDKLRLRELLNNGNNL